jgi:predicted ATP-dependent endonuclease of OLD family
LLKKLMRYLYEETNNQYFIATHSNAVLDAVPCSVFHLRLEDGRSIVRPALSNWERFSICVDLGYRASDLLQANSIIWVEGPSDRVYLNHWIKALRPECIEGLHYSLMFYGGRLLSHLSANDSEINEFISLPHLNRQMCIVMDSDRNKKGARLNRTKLRVRDEFQREGCLAWVTHGREIENYVSGDLLEQAIRASHSNVRRVEKYGQYAKLTRYDTKARTQAEIDKLKVAHYVASQPANLDVLDLRDRIREVAEFIDRANGLSI